MTYVIGDVHGMFSEFLLLLDAIHNDARSQQADADHADKNPAILIVGDLVDRGPQTSELLEFLIEHQEHPIHSVQGNHDIWFCKSVRDAQNNTHDKENLFSWLSQGGFETISSYTKLPGNYSARSLEAMREHLCAIPEKHVNFLETLPLLIETNNCIVTHALCDRRYYTLLQEHRGRKVPEYIQLFVQWNRDEPAEAISQSKIHVSGHTPIQNVRYFRRTNAVNIDTGAVFGGRLSALCIETQQLLSIDTKTHRFAQTHLEDR